MAISSNLLPLSNANSNNTSLNGVTKLETRHYGYDNCKLVFMLLVVLWHTAQLSILEATLSWGSGNYNMNDGSDNAAASNASLSFWERASHQQLHHHASWTPLVSHMVLRYWLWTEKIAVPGFAFLSGFFGKAFLHSDSTIQPTTITTDPAKQLELLHRNQQKNRVRWEKTISTLLLGPLQWQVVSWLFCRIVTGLHSGNWSLEANGQLELWDNLASWYLFALLAWRIWTTLFLSRLRQDGYLPFFVSLVMAWLSAHTQREGPQELRMRVFYFFPYYVAGLYCSDGHFHSLIRRVHGMLGKSESWQSQHDLDRAGRRLGLVGILVTLLVCLVVPRDDLGWMYSIHSYHFRPHVVFLLQYILAGVAVVSVILVVKTISVALFPWSHGNSTLAIYQAHWPVANWLAWANLPYTGINVKQMSLVQEWIGTWSPLPAVLGLHLLCYLVCVTLGSHVVWNGMLRHLCDPTWACAWLFSNPNMAAAEDAESCQRRGGNASNSMTPLTASPPPS